MKKTLSILLAIVMLLSMSTPVLAADSTEEPYAIWVDGTQFYSDTAAEGENWTYDPENKILSLQDYFGSEIVSYGNLTIISRGETIIQGNQWHGVYCEGSVGIICVDGSLEIYGGTARPGRSGYCAVCSDEGITIYNPTENATISLTGGFCDQDGYYGGNALHAPYVELLGDGMVTVTGGASEDPSVFGGYAIYTEDVVIGTKCWLTGGSGFFSSPAVCFYGICMVGHNYAVVQSSAPGNDPFSGDGEFSIKYSDYSYSEELAAWIFVPRDYTLTLDGAGGTMDEQASVVLPATFFSNITPAEVDLSSYTFTRPGYQQTGWQTPDGTTLSLDASYEPPFDPYSSENTNITLTAIWEPVVIPSVPMYRMYDPNSGEHFYTGSTEERDGLVNVGWNYEGVAFNFPVAGAPVYRLYDPVNGDHLYTMDETEKADLLAQGWRDEGVAFNSAAETEVAQYRLWNPNAYNEPGRRGAWHFTSSTDERDFLVGLGWVDQGIGWYSEWA